MDRTSALLSYYIPYKRRRSRWTLTCVLRLRIRNNDGYYVIYIMVASGFLPACIHNNRLYFLFGLESPNEKDSPGWSDFTGTVEKNEDILEAGLREFTEEFCGYLGNVSDFRTYLQEHGGFFPFTHGTYHIHIFFLNYNEDLVYFFNHNHKFIYEKLDHAYLDSTRIFEKIQIQWMTPQMALSRITEFRHFYRKILRSLCSKNTIQNIREFLSAAAASPPPPMGVNIRQTRRKKPHN